jgi:hypothetical protein
MAMALSIGCVVRCDQYRARAKRPRNARRVSGRLAALAVVVAALVLMAYGQHWLLQQAPAAGSELAMATYAVDVLSDGVAAVATDPNGTQRDNKGSAR